MVFLQEFRLPSREDEEDYFCSGEVKTRRTCYPSRYPFGVFRNRELPAFRFAPITFFYGGNGSGKSTLLQVIAEKLRIRRGAPYNRSEFFEDYVSLCDYRMQHGTKAPEDSRIITSDDVFDYLLDLRSIHDGIETRRASLIAQYAELREQSYRLTSLEDYETWRFHADAKAKRRNVSAFVRKQLPSELPERSNGESALLYFTESIREQALYLLDEPENSLSAALQLELKQFLADSARFYGCQFLISTHSPFLLSMSGATVYDLDAAPPRERRWTELENIRLYHALFREHEEEFS